MLWFALAFLLGDVWVQQLPDLTLHSLLPAFYVAGVLLALTWVRRWSGSTIARSVMIAFMLGLLWASLHGRLQLQQDLAPELEGEDLTMIGHIDSIPEIESYGVRFRFAIESIQAGLPQQVELTWYEPPANLQAAQRWQLTVRLKRRHGFANPGGYDYEAHLFRSGIGATGYVRQATSQQPMANQLLGMADHKYLLRTRAALAEAISKAIPEAPMQGVIRGLAVGDQQAISSDAWQVFARTGTSHLMAISGFHIGMVAWLCAWLGSRGVYLPMAQRRGWTVPDLRALFGMSGALGYSLLAGMSVPTQRTLVMLAVYFGASLLRRAVNVWHSFGVALLLVLLIDPFAPLAVGTWLSFGAVAVILLNQQGRVGHGPGWREFLNIQAVVTLGLVPLLLSSFGGLSLVSPLVNLLAIPLFTAVLVPLVLIGCGLLIIHTGAAIWWLGWLAWVLDLVFVGLQWCAELPWATWYAPQAAPWAMTLLVLGTVMMVLPWLWPLRVTGLLCCLPALAWQVPLLPAGAFAMTTLDVGQGLAVVINTRHHVLLYDAGPRFQSGRDTGELVVLPYLRATGVRHLDVLMASHGDDDHVGGLLTVLTAMQVHRVLPGPSVPLDQPRPTCLRGQHWEWDGVQFDVLHPSSEHAGHSDNESDNNLSCVLRVSGGGGSALLLGDVEKRMELDMVGSGLIAPTTVVVAAHHGSGSSSTESLVRVASAEWVIFSAGYRNRWDFPKEEVIARWQAAGSKPVGTIESGAVTATLVPGRSVAIQHYRQIYRRYWSSPH